MYAVVSGGNVHVEVRRCFIWSLNHLKMTPPPPPSEAGAGNELNSQSRMFLFVLARRRALP